MNRRISFKRPFELQHETSLAGDRVLGIAGLFDTQPLKIMTIPGQESKRENRTGAKYGLVGTLLMYSEALPRLNFFGKEEDGRAKALATSSSMRLFSFREASYWQLSKIYREIRL